MKLSQAFRYFNQVPIDLYDGQAWRENATKASIEAFNRVVSARGLTRPRRIVKTNERLASEWQALRFPGSEPHLIVAHNQDVGAEGVYNHVYQADEAPHTAELLRYETRRLSSGSTRRDAEPTVAATMLANYARLGSLESTTFDDVNYTRFEIVVPAAYEPLIDSDAEIRLDGVMFNVLEYAIEGLSVSIVGARRKG